MPSEKTSIRVKGARQHNLQNVEVEIPREQLVVITGVSGSGKSSLAFDTLYAEGQRRYVESLSTYARQFLDRMQKPEVDHIEGLSPAIAIEQRVSAASPRSTIATTTEIYDYLRLLFSATGVPHDPGTGEVITRKTPQQICDEILSWPEGTRFLVLAPLVGHQKGEFRDVMENARREGFVRLRLDGRLVELAEVELPRLNKSKPHTIEAVVDRLIVRDGARERLTDSLEMALRWGQGRAVIAKTDLQTQQENLVPFSTDYSNPRTGFTIPQLTPKHFSFNGHLGACPACHGVGTEASFDSELMVDAERSLEQGCILSWKTGNPRMKAFYAVQLKALLEACPVPVSVPFRNLPQAFKTLLFDGGPLGEGSKPFEGLRVQAARLFASSESELTRKRLRAFQSHRACGVCRGQRLKPEILAVTLADAAGRELNIQDLCALPASEALDWMTRLEFPPAMRMVMRDVLIEIRQRLQFLVDVGLGYLQLNRESGTLSGGESQRIRLATQIGSGLAGVLYVLDEPSIGLHQQDNDRLITTLRSLRDLGNSVIVVEHDEDTIRAADHILDIGPGAGPRGGRVVAQGAIGDILSAPESLTGDYLSGRLKIPVPRHRVAPLRPRRAAPGEGWLVIRGARENNLQNIEAAFPVGCMTCVTGVSGSGKSTLVNDILHAALARDLYRAKARPGAFSEILGAEQFDKVIVIDQSPVGRTPRSNPATYSGAMGAIRELFSGLPASRVRGYDAGRFSLNIKGGRCEHCEGNGVIRIEMHFLADAYVECEVCRGRRYNRETLEINYKGKNIADVLEMNISEAARFFRNIPSITSKLDTLLDVGLGYLRLGQPATMLSGGEAQRLKLAAELARRATGRTIYLLDEPTTGLHFADIHKLLEVLMKLRDARNTLIVIEHNLEVIKSADWVLDLGPLGGAEGGRIVAEGTPEDIADCLASLTGKFLARTLRSQ